MDNTYNVGEVVATIASAPPLRDAKLRSRQVNLTSKLARAFARVCVFKRSCLKRLRHSSTIKRFCSTSLTNPARSTSAIRNDPSTEVAMLVAIVDKMSAAGKPPLHSQPYCTIVTRTRPDSTYAVAPSKSKTILNHNLNNRRHTTPSR